MCAEKRAQRFVVALVCGAIGLPFLPSLDAEEWKLELGGSFRSEVESFQNFNWEPEADDTYYLHRTLLDLDLSYGERFRVYAQPIHALSIDKVDISPVNEDRLELSQLYFDIGLADRWSLRAGRQGIALGAQRLVSLRLGPNVPRSFDGIRLTFDNDAFTFDALAASEVENRQLEFDNPVLSDEALLWGAYGTLHDLHAFPGALDVYYLGFQREASRLPLARGERETRHSFGFRYFGETEGGWDWDLESLVQIGEAAGRDIRAWTAAAEVGYQFSSVPFEPRFALKTSISSGDRGDSSKGTIETFSPLFPKGDYFSESALLGPYNHIELHPTLALTLSERATLLLQYTAFWRQSNDAVYDVPGFAIRDGGGSNERFVGHEISANLGYQITDRLFLELAASHFVPGGFVEETGSNSSVTYGKAGLRFSF